MRKFNIDHQSVVIDHSEGAVTPGESYDFTKEQIEAGIAGLWSDDDPRLGLPEEHAFKQKRDRKTAEPDVPAETEPESGEDKEN